VAISIEPIGAKANSGLQSGESRRVDFQFFFIIIRISLISTIIVHLRASTSFLLGEEMMGSVLRQDGEIKWVEENVILKDNDGVGALLRFRSSR